MCQSIQTGSGSLQLRNLPIQCSNPGCSQVMCACAIETRVEFEQFPNFRQRETRLLRPTNEPQPTNMVIAVATNAVAPWRRIKKPFALVKADRFYADAPCFGEFSD